MTSGTKLENISTKIKVLYLKIRDPIFESARELNAWAKIHQPLLSQFSLLVEFLIGKVPVKD